MKSKILLGLILLLSLSTFAQSEGNVIRVQGSSTVSEIPELMIINIDVKSEDSVYSKCSEKLISNYNNIEKAFVKNGISKDKLKSEGVRISEKYSWQERERKKDGFEGNISINLELPYSNKNLNTVMKVLEKELSQSYKLSFTLSDKQKDKLLQQAIELAVLDAKTKAEYIANSLNVKLQEIKDVNFGYQSYNNDLLVRDNILFSVESYNSESMINLNPKKMEIKKTIGVVWSIKQ